MFSTNSASSVLHEMPQLRAQFRCIKQVPYSYGEKKLVEEKGIWMKDFRTADNPKAIFLTLQSSMFFFTVVDLLP